MKILVLGSKGQIGMCLEEQLKKFTSFEVIFSSRSNLDITNLTDFNAAVNNINPDIIINTAAYTNVDKAEDEKVTAELINNLAVQNLSQLCTDKNIALIHISTDYIFDGSSDIPYLETDVGNPISFYGKSKLDGEIAITNSGCKFVILRTSWVYSEYGNNFVKTIVRLCKDQDKISIIDDQIGCPTYAQDIAKAIINITHFIQKDICEWGIYNYCGNTPLTWYQFAQMISKKNIHVDNDVEILPISSVEYSARAMRPKFSLLNCSKYQENFKSDLSNLKKGLERTLGVLNLEKL